MCYLHRVTKNGSPQYLGIFAHYICKYRSTYIWHGTLAKQTEKVTKVIEFPDNPAYISGKI